MAKKLRNIHPGEVLLEEFLNPMGISQNALARATGVPPRRINEIVLGKRALSAVSAVSARLPSTISLMRRGGTPVARASAFWLIPMGPRNSSAPWGSAITRLGMGKELLRVEQARA